MKSEFVHLHNHSDYSLLDGAQNVNVLVNTIDDLGMDAVALTEHGNMFSVIPYYKAAHQAGIKPIIGCEIYVAQGSRFDKASRATGGWGNNHLVLLAQNYTGYKNLMKLVTFGYLEGFYYRPRIDMELLREYNSGLICMSACLKGAVPEKMLRGDWTGARETALEFAEMFPDRYYLEIQNHGIPEEAANIENMVKLSRDLNLPLVATNDAHYAIKDHAEAHDIHICLGTGKDRNDPNRLRYATPEFYFKSQDEMFELFNAYPDALENTRRIADSIDVEIPMDTYHLPEFPIPEDASTQDPDHYLEQLTRDGLRERYGEITPELQKRMDHELAVIKKMGFAGYFLITGDFVRYAKDQSIPVGPGRGSAAGSLVSYALGITTIDPIQHNLLFERFLNPERISMPDIDIDFCIERRQEVIDYIKSRYGENSVTQIITFGKMKARAVVRDVGRVLGYSFGEVDRLAKMIPEGPKVTLKKALEENPKLKEAAETTYKELFDNSLILEGMNRHASTHAAGVVIAPGDLTEYVPLYKSNKDDITTQYDMKGLEDLGLLKMDFLGLRNLTVINRAIQLIGERRQENINIEKIPMDDPDVYSLFAKGLTIGIFQFESSGMREFLKKLKPTVIEDLIAMNALYRPGPMENIDDFIQRKRGRKKITYLHPSMEPILKETYGIIVYQEQVMQLANAIAGFSLADADIMRRAMGKKIASLMAEMSEKFIAGAVERGVPKKKAQEIFFLIEKFAQYGFNKSHSTAYAYVAYQTAWLKAHYPAEFMSANLTSEMSSTDRVVILINECRKLGIKVNPPDINLSRIQFYPSDEKTITFGLNAIKNVGSKALEKIIEAREEDGPFKTLFDFTARVDLRAVNKKVLESLIMAGAMDSLPGTRAAKFKAVDEALKYGQQVHQQGNKNQFDLFGNGDNGQSNLIREPVMGEADEWPEQERLDKEKEVTGLYMSGHPLLKYAEELEELSTFDFSEKVNSSENDTVRIGGIIHSKKIHIDKKQRRMCFFNMDCLGGQAEVLSFSRTYADYESLIEDGNVVFIVGRPTDNNDFTDLKLIAEEIVPIAKARDHFSRRIHVQIDPKVHTADDIENLRATAEKFPGPCRLVFIISNGERKQRIMAHNIKVSPDKKFLSLLRECFGKRNVWIST
ncbi:MAG: DNA polymerase III subunit alpha [Fidelibacterota bacterium]